MTSGEKVGIVAQLEARGDELSLQAAKIIEMQQDKLYEYSQEIRKLSGKKARRAEGEAK